MMSETRPTCITVVTHIGGIRQAKLLEGCCSIAVARDWVVQLVHPTDLHLLNDWKPDGLLILDECDAAITWAQAHNRPQIGVCTNSACAATVELDDQEVGRVAARYLLQRGLRSFAGYGLANHEFSRERLSGFSQVISDEGAAYDAAGEQWLTSSSALATGNFGGTRPRVRSQATISRWLDSLPKPVGVFASCDFWGMELENVCMLSGLRIPEEVAVIGVDDDPLLCNVASPPLSSVQIPWRTAGRWAAELLGDLMNGGGFPTRANKVQPSGVTSRRSTDIFSVEDPDVAAALAVIHAHADKPLTVAEILRRVPAHPNRLERGFKRLLGRSMLQELARVHVEQARHLLVSTDLSIAEVAQRSGFSSSRRLSEALRAVTGMTPTQLRSRHNGAKHGYS